MSRMHRPARALLASLVLALVTLLPTPAHAADSPSSSTCRVKLGNPASVRRAAADADAVFAAKVLHATQLRGARGGSGWQLHVRVAAGFSGTPRKGGPADIQLTGSVKRPPAEQATYLFFVRKGAAGFVADVCGGVQKLAKGVTSTLRGQIDAGLRPSSSDQVSVSFRPVQGSARDLPALGRLLAPGAGLALLGVLGLLLFRRLARERA